MINQISGYQILTYDALLAYQQRISGRKGTCLQQVTLHEDIFFQFGMVSLRLGKWLLKFSSMPYSEIQSICPF